MLSWSSANLHTEEQCVFVGATGGSAFLQAHHWLLYSCIFHTIIELLQIPVHCPLQLQEDIREYINFILGFTVHWCLLSRPLSLPLRGGSCCSLRCLSSSCSCLCCSSFCSFSRSSCCCLMARSSCCSLHRTKRHEKMQFAVFSRSILAKITPLNNWVLVLFCVLTLLFTS